MIRGYAKEHVGGSAGGFENRGWKMWERQRTSVAAFCMVAMMSGAAGIVSAATTARYPDSKINGIEWFYAFGPQGRPTYGAEPGPKAFFVELPKHLEGSVVIRVLDADIRGRHDEQDGVWDTATKFSVFGGQDRPLGSEIVTAEAPDGSVLSLGPFRADQGEVQGDRLLFRIEVEGVEGNDSNLFAFEIEPGEARLFAFSPSIRLAERQGELMHFYPEIPSGLAMIRAGNHDLDPDGGSAALLASAGAAPRQRGAWKVYPLRNSDSAQWAWTELSIPQEWSDTQWMYQLTKATQPRANASLRVEDAQGKPLPIYFSPRAPKPQAPQMACNTFEFDASKSYDPDDQQLSFHWEFGDAATAEGIRVRHTYEKAGDYRALLTVTDNSTGACRLSKTEQWVRVNTPPKAVIQAPRAACAGSTVQLSAKGSADVPEDDLSFRWDLGDGTIAEGPVISHAYPQGGTYQIKLLVDDNRGSSCSSDQAMATIRVNSSPIAKANDAIRVCSRNPAAPLEVTFDGTASRDPDNEALSYHWDFGDGNKAEGAKVSHTYQQGGSYAATLLVDDGSGSACSIAMAQVPVLLNRSPIASRPRDVMTCEREIVAFDAGSASDLDGDPVAVRWDFGDGETAMGQTAQHRYTKGGLYRVNMIADDGSGTSCAFSTASFNVQVNSRPFAALDAEESGCAGRPLAFDAASSLDPEGQRLNYAWDFGDGTTAQGAKVQHAYLKDGRYPVTLKIDDGQGTACSFALAKAEVSINAPPIADAGSNLVCCRGDVNVFDASKSSDPDGDALSYQWDFGDGRIAEGIRVEHTYAKRGAYPVRVTVSDGSGSACGTSTSGFVAAVNATPVARMAVLTEGGRLMPATSGEPATAAEPQSSPLHAGQEEPQRLAAE